ncbi:MAG: FAD-binding oxidoreductase [Acidimicrobiales bacterium]
MNELVDRFGEASVELPAGFVERISSVCATVDTSFEARAESGRDWWPLAQRWALGGVAPARPHLVARPRSLEEVSAVARLCNEAVVPLTPAGGRSGVCGGSVPVFGGVALDCCALKGITAVDEKSLLVDVKAGTFGPELEEELRNSHGLTVGHFPQSIELATVGGWLACRGAGQYSTRYGKIEDIVAGLEVVLADGRVIRTGACAGAGPRSAMGPDLTQLFVGSEGTLWVITAARLRAHPAPGENNREKSAFGFSSFEQGLEALRRTLRRGATPAVLRLYDTLESGRSFDLGESNVLIALDEGDEAVRGTAMRILAEECSDAGGERFDSALVDRWISHRNDVSALASVTRAGIVADTIEVAAPWTALGPLYRSATGALFDVPGCLSASAHESHAYLDGACLYFTFAGRGEEPSDDDWAEGYYRASWDAVMRAARAHGASISHHHGIGLVRGPYLREALGETFAVLVAMKAALDPAGILNPGKLGLPSVFGTSPWEAS